MLKVLAKLTGWRSIVVAVLGIAWNALASAGIDVPLADRESIVNGVLLLVLLLVRIFGTRSETPARRMIIDAAKKMKPMIVGLFFCVGCASLAGGGGTGNLDTVKRQIATAAIAIESIASLTTEMVQKDVIRVEQARQIANVLRPAYEALAAAFDLIETTGDVSTAGTAIEAGTQAALIALRLLQQFIGEHNAISASARLDSEDIIRLSDYRPLVGGAEGQTLRAR